MTLRAMSLPLVLPTTLSSPVGGIVYRHTEKEMSIWVAHSRLGLGAGWVVAVMENA
jgi:hypothetical protein